MGFGAENPGTGRNHGDPLRRFLLWGEGDREFGVVIGEAFGAEASGAPVFGEATGVEEAGAAFGGEAGAACGSGAAGATFGGEAGAAFGVEEAEDAAEELDDAEEDVPEPASAERVTSAARAFALALPLAFALGAPMAAILSAAFASAVALAFALASALASTLAFAFAALSSCFCLSSRNRNAASKSLTRFFIVERASSTDNASMLAPDTVRADL